MTDPLDDQNARCDAKDLIVKQGTQKLGSMIGVQISFHGRVAILDWRAGFLFVVLQSFWG